MAIDTNHITDDTKLQNFSRHVHAQAAAQRDETMQEIEKRKAQIKTAAEISCYEDAYQKIQKGKVRIQREVNEQLSRIQLESKKRLTLRRSALMEEVFISAKKRLIAFTLSEQYYPWLLNCAKTAIQGLGGGEIDVYINAADEQYKEKLQSDCGHRVLVLDNKDNIIGGVRALNAKTHMACSDTLELRLEEQKSEFLKISKLNI